VTADLAQRDETRPDAKLPPNSTVDALIRVAAARFTDLGFLAPDGLLDLPLDLGRVQSIRLDLPPGEVLQLQSIGIDAQGADDTAGVAQVRASSWHEGYERTFEPARLFDIDRPTGTVIHTEADHPAWVEVRFSHALTVTRVRVRNVSVDTARRARGLRVSVRRWWRTRVIYDGGAQLRAWRGLLKKAKAGVESEPEAVALLDVLDLTVKGEYGRAHRSLASHVSDERSRHWFRAAVNEELLRSRGLEWTVHGPQRPFRSWSEEERLDYVRDSAAVVQALQSLTPNVCFGFGSVLSVVRDKALIPHDDDLDIIVGFEPDEAATLTDGLRRVEEHLRPMGYEVSGRFAAHRHVRRPGRKRVDVFVGVFEAESISWYPGARGGLTREIVFPTGSADLLGVPCSIPAQPEVYLERLYGKGWRVPDPYFSHAWNLSDYADITGAPPKTPRQTTTSTEGAEAP
jgi:hypothetical protein